MTSLCLSSIPIPKHPQARLAANTHLVNSRCASSRGGSGIAPNEGGLLAIDVLESRGDAGLHVSPCPHVLGLFLNPHNLCVGVPAKKKGFKSRRSCQTARIQCNNLLRRLLHNLWREVPAKKEGSH